MRHPPDHEELQDQNDSDDLLSTLDAPLISDQPQETYEFAFESMFSTNLIVRHLTLKGTSEVAFWAETSEWKKEPDLVFHEGGKDGPVAGSGIMRKRNHEMTFRIGGNGTVDDHSVGDELATVNQDKKWRDSAYTLAIPTISAHAPRLYHFTRTQSTKDGVQGFAAKLAYYNWIISNVRREKVGLYLENPKNGISLTRGNLTLNPDTLDDPTDLLVLLLGLVAINERTRRDLNLTIAIT
ncbi:hypothetical protein QFC20_001863 [Naganishia adeliensis]|uniref:Uncharacterized protein n=1 Tax=Naganishia adeliensis TaxID=92952 RepID=A0ACC2WPF6_9TREE|nr:hypothetical protein QFC20_001863 [Naganishia adeliensis]